MSRLLELMSEMSRGGVEHTALGEVGRFIRGSGLQKKDLRPEGAPAVHYGEIHTRYGVWITATRSFTDAATASKLRHARPGDLLIATTSEDDHAVAKATAWLGDTDVALSSDAFIYRHELDPKYVAYFFQSKSFQLQKRRYISGAKVRRISGESLAKIRIPVPPLEVQRELSSILDRFTRLQAQLKEELTAELEARRIQREHYRNALLDFAADEAVERKSLGDLGELFGGLTGKTKSDFTNGNFRFASYKNVYQNIALDVNALDFVKVGAAENQRALAFGDVIFTGSSESLDDVGMSSVVSERLEDPMYLNSFCIGFRPRSVDELTPAFAKHLFRSDGIRRQIIKTASGVTRINISKSRLANIQVPVPAVERQAQLAAVLDRLDRLVNDLTVDLNAELAARRKQYEYYRDKLLTFKELPA